MEKQTVYLVCGISGSGKSWVCSHLKDRAQYVESDRIDISSAVSFMTSNKGPFLYDLHKPVVTFISKNKDKLDIKLVVILGDYLEVKARLKQRAGKDWRYSIGMRARWNRIVSLAKHEQAIFSGSSTEVLKFLRSRLDKRKHLIYKVTSPSGKVYIGKTSLTLARRKICHEYDANARNKSYSFSRAIRKYGSNLKWEILVDDITSSEEASFLEKKYIHQYDSTNPEKGYNLTFGGDGGGKLTADLAISKSKKIREFYESEDGLAVKERLRQSSSLMRRSEIGAMIDSKVRAKRSSVSSRNKTSQDLRERYSDIAAREKLSSSLKKLYEDPSLKRKVSLAVRAARARPFDVWSPTGELLGTWDSASTCAEDLDLNRGNISNCLHGRSPSHRGYRFKFKD